MKKTLALFLAVVMVLGLAACGAKNPEDPAATEATDELFIGYVISDMSHEWYQNINGAI